jgi:hypothetical protein
MDEIQTRLQETSQNCMKAYSEWVGRKKDAQAQEKLQAAIHELRKVASRLEIDLAISERDQNAVRPLAVPSHRSAKGNAVESDDEGQDFSDADDGNSDAAQKRRRIQSGMQRRPHQGGTSHSQGGNNE